MPLPCLRVTVPRDVARSRTFTFTGDFRIGRSPSCELQILHGEAVSLRHVRVVRFDDTWYVIDLNSTPVTFVGRKRVAQVAVHEQTAIRLGRRGPVLVLSPETETEAAADHAPTTRLRRDFAQWRTWAEEHVQEIVADLRGAEDDVVSPRTPFALAQARRRRWFVAALAGLMALLLGAGIHTLVQQARLAAQERELAEHRENARTLFYSMRAIEVDLIALNQALSAVTDPNVLNPITRVREQRHENLERYEAYAERLGLFDNMAPDERVIHRVLSRFGEFSLDVPPAFIDSVRHQIRLWKIGSGYERAIERARRSGLTRRIPQILAEHDLPAEFFYLALQESHLQPNRTGPPTHSGYAKGLWQFIPATAERYGLDTGSSTHLPAYDPKDERFDVEKSTEAAARHLRTLYSEYAQASGLLVMAAYNWGEGHIQRYTRAMPDTPQDRNFWRLLETKGRVVPRETRTYVFRIVAAAAIGEDPRLFGFDFDNPLTAPALPVRTASDTPTLAP